ncbi:MAG: hypothetical protein ABEI52_12745, partial [Halobacteriaceae archaeon]
AKVINPMGASVGTGLDPMPETDTTTVTQDKDGYYRVRVPKSLGDAMGLAGEKVEWEVESAGALTMRKHD